MTDREKLQIEYYLPNPPDPELDLMEYYVEDMRGRAVKVTFSNIGFDKQGEEILQCRDTAGHLVHGPYECEVCGRKTEKQAMPWIAEKEWNAGNTNEPQLSLF